MIPDFFVSVAQLPRTVSGKTDKLQLSKAIQEIPPLELRAYFAAQRNKKRLETETAEMEISSHDVLRHPTIAEWAAIVDAQQADAFPS
ncbi:hypothetical protein PENARI_c066G08282 [Penicillium arizonense]|uniref:AMP-binding enzyme C-terminal domain-containing protein n=1 Tax=Penicillium arizonense TaxID=1835702 RepID=A0A1F5L206_PENAI|nr:hypothetical protein PENARI_c066G08282 [Penicillium arizonense]OGE47086.1 hypothetical protein PENARI_c066G08282 [Penicillium arizonense]